MDQQKEFPEIIQEHLGSPKTTSIIHSINERIDIARTDIIPNTIRRFVEKEFSPKDFVKKLSEYTKFREEKALAVAIEIKEKIFKPIEYALLNWGVDINEINTDGAKSIQELKGEEEQILESIGIKIEKPTTTISLETSPEESILPKKIFVDGSVDVSPKKIEVTEEPAPLVIHREKQAPSGATGQSQQTKGFSLPFGFFKQRVVPTEAPSSPIKATVEFLKNDKPQRAVDYSELRTPLTPFAKEEKFIQTDSQKPVVGDSVGDIKKDVLETKTSGVQQPIVQKVNPLVAFGNKQTTQTPNIPKLQQQKAPEQTTQNKILDIRTGVFNNQQLKNDVGRPVVSAQKNIQAPAQNKPALPTQNTTIPIVQTPQLSKSFPVPEKPKPQTIVNTTNNKERAVLNESSIKNTNPKPINQVPVKQNNPSASGSGFVWFKKPAQKITDNNTIITDKKEKQDEGLKIDGNIVDLRQTNNNNN